MWRPSRPRPRRSSASSMARKAAFVRGVEEVGGGRTWEGRGVVAGGEKSGRAATGEDRRVVG